MNRISHGTFSAVLLSAVLLAQRPESVHHEGIAPVFTLEMLQLGLALDCCYSLEATGANRIDTTCPETMRELGKSRSIQGNLRISNSSNLDHPHQSSQYPYALAFFWAAQRLLTAAAILARPSGVRLRFLRRVLAAPASAALARCNAEISASSAAMMLFRCIRLSPY